MRNQILSLVFRLGIQSTAAFLTAAYAPSRIPNVISVALSQALLLYLAFDLLSSWSQSLNLGKTPTFENLKVQQTARLAVRSPRTRLQPRALVYICSLCGEARGVQLRGPLTPLHRRPPWCRTRTRAQSRGGRGGRGIDRARRRGFSGYLAQPRARRPSPRTPTLPAARQRPAPSSPTVRDPPPVTGPERRAG